MQNFITFVIFSSSQLQKSECDDLILIWVSRHFLIAVNEEGRAAVLEKSKRISNKTAKILFKKIEKISRSDYFAIIDYNDKFD